MQIFALFLSSLREYDTLNSYFTFCFLTSRIELIILKHTIICLCKVKLIVLIFSFLVLSSLFPKALTLMCAIYVLGWYVSWKDSVILCRFPFGIYVNNAKLLLSSYFFFHSTPFLKFMFLCIHLVLTAAGFFMVCIHHILLLHSHNDRTVQPPTPCF